jgi:phosphatidylserine synthase
MVSTIRFRSLKNLDLTSPRSYKVIVPVAAWVALMTAYTEEVLVVMAYTYLASPIIEWAVVRIRRPMLMPPPAPSEPPAEPPVSV